jgi:hypothetical protein
MTVIDCTDRQAQRAFAIIKKEAEKGLPQPQKYRSYFCPERAFSNNTG